MARRLNNASGPGLPPFRSIGENLAFWGVITGLLPEKREVAANLVETWFKSPGHRKSFMDPSFAKWCRHGHGTFPLEGTDYNADMGGQNFGKRDVHPFLTGVGCRTQPHRHPHLRCDDAHRRRDGHRDPAERSTGSDHDHFPTGDYDLQLPDGTWDIRIVGGGLPEPVELKGLTLSGQNIKQDFTPVFTNRWHNSARPMDVNNDKFVTPQDALIVINDLNAHGGHNLPYITSPPQYFLDVNRDNVLSPSDCATDHQPPEQPVR